MNNHYWPGNDGSDLYSGLDLQDASSLPENLTILGPTLLSPEQLDAFVRTVHPGAPKLGSYYSHLGGYYGIRGDVAYAQAIHETDYFRYTGVVRSSQNNYAGIGATGGDVRGASFETAEQGVLAHLQHLYAYATEAPLPDHYPLVDPRFDLVNRGSAPTWVDLNGKWAVPGDTYGQSILNLYGRMLQFATKDS
ncbi:glucosaminidase domain-containing protein [Bacillus sp. FJAT-27251]|uniref:glucosaminidase domain-containing protein n=1 Tax=Bacillus sp. FJAT-27251 TaxID=1684142 RepID=UPI0006A7E8D0|nr:glucosaminidase domain-containing protein [Bacillus sp. FJAT-27251]